MTLDEYEKILEEKKKALQSQTTSERKVDTKEFESMQQLSNKKKSNDEIFIKLVRHISWTVSSLSTRHLVKLILNLAWIYLPGF